MTKKFRHWDNKFLFQNYERTVQILGKVEELCVEDTLPEDLPMSMIPTDILYDIASSYEAMYKKLLELELLTSGYPKATNTTH